MTYAGIIHPEKTSKPIAIATKSLDPVDRKEDHEYIPWVNERKLNWDDYHCPPVTNTDAVASTSTALGIAYQVVNGKLVYHITCGFSKIKSWGLLKTDYILAHEQAHFDITEIYARKLYEALQNYEFNRKSYKNDINAIYQDIVKQKEDLQELYDGETDHSRNHKKQYQWLDKVGKMLQDSEAYSNYP
jgi:hypothetical protein